MAKKGSTLSFVEVKARWSSRMGYPEEALTKAKKKRLLKLAHLYLSQYPHEGDVRLDVIAIDFSGKRPQIRHYEGAFYAEETET